MFLGSCNSRASVVSVERVRRIMEKRSSCRGWKVIKVLKHNECRVSFDIWVSRSSERLQLVRNGSVNLLLIWIPRQYCKYLSDFYFSLGGGYGDGTDIRKLAYFESAINPEYAKGKVSKVIIFGKRRVLSDDAW